MRPSDYIDLANFAIENSGGHFFPIHRDIIAQNCRNFDQVGQLIVVRRDGGIIGATYFDLLSDTADIKEIVIHRDHRNEGLLKQMILQGILTYPFIQYIQFSRRKYGDRPRKYHFTEFFKGELIHGS